MFYFKASTESNDNILPQYGTVEEVFHISAEMFAKSGKISSHCVRASAIIEPMLFIHIVNVKALETGYLPVERVH